MTRVPPAAVLTTLALLLAGCTTPSPAPADDGGASPTCAPESCHGAPSGSTSPTAPPQSPAPTTSSSGTATPDSSATPATSARPTTPSTPVVDGPPPPPCSNPPCPDPSREACDARATTLTHDVTDTSRISHIIPTGNVVGGGTVKAHSHVFPVAPYQVPVYAPVALTVTRITYYREAGDTAYLLHLAADCRTAFRVDHLGRVADKLAALDPPLRDDSRNDDPPIAVPFAAGELLGETTGGAATSFFDFGMVDEAVTNENVQNRSAMAIAVHAVCPYERYPPELRATYLALLATPNGTRTGETSCRGPARDVGGTLQGSWFLGEANNDFGARAAIAPDIDGTVFFALTSPSGERLDLRDMGARDPSTVTGGETVCYQGDTGPFTGYGWARLSADARTVELAWGEGPCPSGTQGTPAGVVTYAR